jgi:hypothetical protein
LDTVKDGFGFSGALHRLALDGLANNSRFVMLLDGYGLRIALARLAGVVGIAVTPRSRCLMTRRTTSAVLLRAIC